MRKGSIDPTAQSKDLFSASSELEQFASFDDLVQAIGGINQLYAYASISGFRVGSEIISDPIHSNGLGCTNSSSATKCTPRSINSDGVVTAVENLLGLFDGEFYMQWLRDVL